MADIIDFDEATPAQQTAATIRSDLTGWFHHSRGVFLNCDRYIWSNPHGLTPQEAFTSLNARAANCLAVVTKLAQLLNTYAPDRWKVASSKPPGVTLTSNPDGTVTVNGA